MSPSVLQEECASACCLRESRLPVTDSTDRTERCGTSKVTSRKHCIKTKPKGKRLWKSHSLHKADGRSPQKGLFQREWRVIALNGGEEVK